MARYSVWREGSTRVRLPRLSSAILKEGTGMTRIAWRTNWRRPSTRPRRRTRRVVACGMLRLATWLAVGLGPVGIAAAGACGGAIPCRCGDTVTVSTTLSADIGVCAGTGLTLVGPVVLDCANHAITGSGLSPARYGVLVDGVAGATVRNCRITGFRKGIRLDGGSGNTVIHNETFTNHDYGIEMAGGSARNRIVKNTVYNNRDEGIHIGAGAHNNKLKKNIVTRNKHENIYVLDSDGTRILLNTVTTNDSTAILLKHSRDSRVVGNTVLYGAVYVRGESVGNTFADNGLRGNGYFFEAYQEPTGEWTFPHDNAVVGGKVENTKTCLRFGGAYDNVVDELALDDECQITMWPLGGQAASGNVINTLPLP